MSRRRSPRAFEVTAEVLLVLASCSSARTHLVVHSSHLLRKAHKNSEHWQRDFDWNFRLAYVRVRASFACVVRVNVQGEAVHR